VPKDPSSFSSFTLKDPLLRELFTFFGISPRGRLADVSWNVLSIFPPFDPSSTRNPLKAWLKLFFRFSFSSPSHTAVGDRGNEIKQSPSFRAVQDPSLLFL